MDYAERRFNEMLARQNKSLDEAVKEYQRRYCRKPPKGFDLWWILLALFSNCSREIAKLKLHVRFKYARDKGLALVVDGEHVPIPSQIPR